MSWWWVSVLKAVISFTITAMWYLGYGVHFIGKLLWSLWFSGCCSIRLLTLIYNQQPETGYTIGNGVRPFILRIVCFLCWRSVNWIFCFNIFRRHGDIFFILCIEYLIGIFHYKYNVSPRPSFWKHWLALDAAVPHQPGRVSSAINLRGAVSAVFSGQ